jgi:pentatricopeptide repeat protein
LQLERAASIIDEMVLAGVVPNECSYTILMEGYARVGEIGKSFQYFNRIKDEGLNVDVISYGSLLKACCKAGRMQNAIAVTKEMTSAGFPMNNFIYNILLDGYL